MISKDERIELKKHLPTRYSELVLEILNARGVKNARGNNHSTRYIHAVLAGSRANVEIENTLYDVAEHTKKKIKEENALKKQRKKRLSKDN